MLSAPTLDTILSSNSIHSMDSMEGVSFSPPGTPLTRITTLRSKTETPSPILMKGKESSSGVNDRNHFESMDVFVAAVNEVFLKKERVEINAIQLKTELQDLFNRVDLSTSETNKYTFWDANKPYTRNLVALNSKYFTLLVLCWNVGKESKIHNHPGEGCYMKTLRGCVRETKYEIDSEQQLKQTSVKFLAEGQLAFIDDSMGLHKIGNPCIDAGAVTLHLYTPPFRSCKVWLRDGLKYGDSTEVSIGFFSVFGVRTPHLEGTQSMLHRVTAELLAKTKVSDS